MKNIGLVLEGGGMRGAFTIGILDFFMEEKFYPPYVIGVSAGACSGASYVARQKGRSRKTQIDYVDDPRFMGFKSLIRKHGFFNMDFLFGKLSTEICPLDENMVFNSPQKFVICTTDCKRGVPKYFTNRENIDLLTIIRASSSLPFVSKPVKYQEYILMDGGISDSIPIKKSLADGNKKNIIILTRDKTYRKEPFKFKKIARMIYPEYDGLLKCIFNRYKVYNKTLDFIEKLEQKGKAFVIRPPKPVKIKRAERDKDKLYELYNQGYNEAKKSFKKLLKWVQTE